MRFNTAAISIVVASAALLTSSPSHAQSRAQSNAEAQRTTARESATGTAPVVNKNLRFTVVNVSCAEVQSPTLPASRATKRPSLSDRIGTAVKKTVVGDPKQTERARNALAERAQRTVSDPNATIIVVMGSAEDVTTVSESLAEIERPIVVAFADTELEDANTCNRALSAGLVGQSGLDATNNILVFLPHAGAAPRVKKTLSTLVVSPTVWNTMFALDGDDAALDQLIAGRRRN